MMPADREQQREQQATPPGAVQAGQAPAGTAQGPAGTAGEEGGASGPAGDDVIVQDRWDEGHAPPGGGGTPADGGRMAGEDGRMAGDGGLGSDGEDAPRGNAPGGDAGLADTTAARRQEGAGPGGGLGPLAPEPRAPLSTGAPGSQAPGSEAPGSQAPGQQMSAPQDRGDAAGQHGKLLTGAELDGIMVRWHEIQAGFVDEPRRAVSEADALVTELIDRLTQTFAREREQLQAQCGTGSDVSTEDLRQGLRGYRIFFERLLTI